MILFAISLMFEQSTVGAARGSLQALPFRPGDTRLFEEDAEQVPADVASMWIGDRNLQSAFPHDLMRPGGFWAGEAATP